MFFSRESFAIMNIPQVHKLSKASQFSLLAIAILLGGVFFTVNNALQTQQSAGHASTGTNYIVNPSFENGKSPWIIVVQPDAAGTFNITNSTAASGNYSADLDVTTSNPNNWWYVQLRQETLPMVAGQTYTVTFWAKASSNRQIQSVVQQQGGAWTVYKYFDTSITTSWQQYSYTFTANASATVYIEFNVASATGNVWIDDVSYSSGVAAEPTTVTTTVNPYSCSTHPTLQQGSSGVCVQRVQWFLNAENNAGLEVDGSFGPLTDAAVRAYQTKYNLTVDGIVGPQTWQALESNFSTKPTLFPTVTSVPISEPTATVIPIATITPTIVPTASPLPTETPIPTPIPTEVPVPTDTPQPGTTTLNLTVGLHGIGTGGDSANPDSVGNMNPLHPSRAVMIDIYDSQNQLVTSQQGTVTFDVNSGKFTGTVDLGTNFATGFYTVKIKTNQYLRALIPGIQDIVSGQINTLPTVTLVAGDINGDNAINIEDYNILIGCYSDLLPATDCTADNNVLADLTDDGHVNQFDYNLFLRELTNIGGQ